jgi:hypothetical protein
MGIAGCDDGGSCPVSVTFHQNGNVGIGTQSPTTDLDIHGAADNHTMARVNQVGIDQWVGWRIDRDSTEKWFIGMGSSNDDLLFRRTGNNDMVINTSGDVGIGTSDPSQKLDVDHGNLVVQGDGSFDANGEEGIVYLGSVHHYIKGIYGFGVKIGAYAAEDVICVREISGRVGIGTTDPDYKLDVNGDINVSGSYNVKKGGTDYNHPDYVFEETYELMPLDQLKEYVRKNKSLPNVVSAEDVRDNDGFKMDELLVQMLEKVEEQTLYIFQLEERIAELEKKQRRP